MFKSGTLIFALLFVANFSFARPTADVDKLIEEMQECDRRSSDQCTISVKNKDVGSTVIDSLKKKGFHCTQASKNTKYKGSCKFDIKRIEFSSVAATLRQINFEYFKTSTRAKAKETPGK